MGLLGLCAPVQGEDVQYISREKTLQRHMRDTVVLDLQRYLTVAAASLEA